MPRSHSGPFSAKHVPGGLPEGDAHQCPARLDRRAFLRDTALFVAGAMAASGLAPSLAFAEQARFIEPLTAIGRERGFPVPVADGVSVDDSNHLVLVRSRDKLYAFSLECPHRGRMLEWQPGGRQFYCPKHKARFSPAGANIGGRRTSALDRYALRRDGSQVVVSLDRVLSEKDTPAEWAGAVVTL